MLINKMMMYKETPYNKRNVYYESVLQEIKSKSPKEEYRSVLSQPECEVEEGFLGFVDIYAWIRDNYNIPKDYTIIDLGCNVAAQAYLFEDYAGYIGVDLAGIDYVMQRFTPKNCTHYYTSIQNFIRHILPTLHINKCVAICSGVPDAEATNMAFETFDNVFIDYPYQTPKVKLTF